MDTRSGDVLKTCFLCHPDERLVFCRGSEGVALAGLGPLVPGYSVIGTSVHTDSLAELPPQTLRNFLDFAQVVRSKLAAKYGSCVLAEHGNSPLCEFDISRDKHCFHPHFLLFPTARDVSDSVAVGAGAMRKFSTLPESVAGCADCGEYLLLSSAPDRYLVFVPEQMLPSQYARSLVATQVGCPELVSWRNTPNHAQALENARTNRLLFNDEAR